MKKIRLLVLVVSLMMCTACAQQQTIQENMGVSDAGETDSGAPARNETVANGAVPNEETTSLEQEEISNYLAVFTVTVWEKYMNSVLTFGYKLMNETRLL